MEKMCTYLSKSSLPDRRNTFRMLWAASMASEDMQEDVKIATDEIMMLVGPLVKTQSEDFRKDLMNPLAKAAELWKQLQRCEQEATSALTADDDSEVYIEEKTQQPGFSRLTNGLLRPFLITFPRIIIQDEIQLLYRGCVIWASSKLAIEADAEVATQLQRVQKRKQELPNNRRRRLSMGTGVSSIKKPSQSLVKHGAE